ncbi:MAG: GAF domain-containing protein [Verrucomicrobia bacterium]|nr:GAF domain-containing protein [Cytophagales bacterium]
MFKIFFRIGVEPALSSYLRVKVILSNQISLIMLLVEAFYMSIAWFHFPVLLPLYWISAACSVLVFIFNAFHFYTVSRLMVATIPALAAGFTYIAVSQGEQDRVVEILLVTFSMMISPFMMFDGRESGLRNLSYLICAIPFLFNQSFNDWIDVPLDPTVLHTEVLVHFNLLVSLGVMFAFLGVLQNTNRKSEEKNRQILETMQKARTETETQAKSLQNTLLELEKAKADDEKRNWVSQGLAQFSTLLQEEDENIYDKLLATLVKYVNANQGSLFLVSHDEEKQQPYLQLSACYAYDRKKFLEKRVEIGEGLLGQCYLEQQPLYLSRIPDNYLSITSGLGEANPRFLLISPLEAGHQVEGLIELAFFQAIESYKIEFLQKLGENIAARIRSNRVSIFTQGLLEETRRQQQELEYREKSIQIEKTELQTLLREKDLQIAQLQSATRPPNHFPSR